MKAAVKKSSKLLAKLYRDLYIFNRASYEAEIEDYTEDAHVKRQKELLRKHKLPWEKKI